MRKLIAIILITGLFFIPYIMSLCYAQTEEAIEETPEETTEKGEFVMPKDPKVVFETNMGSFEARLFPKVAPKACENFIGLVNKGYYNGTIFHRVIPNFMIQGGDPTGTGMGGESIWGGKFEDEFSEDTKFDHAGLLAMANAGPNTNASQFFITVGPTPWLNFRHTIFGDVYYGYDTVEQISKVPRNAKDRPLEEVKILKAYMVKEK